MTTTQLPAQRDEFLWKQAKKRVGFNMHLRSYLLVNAGLWLIYLVTNAVLFSNAGVHITRFPWPLAVMFSWGIGLSSHYFGVYAAQSGERGRTEREYQKLLNQQR